MEDYPGLTPSDKADVKCRVFEQKVEDFLRVLKEQDLFGRCTGGIKQLCTMNLRKLPKH